MKVFDKYVLQKHAIPVLLLLISGVLLPGAHQKSPAPLPNVLFIAIDDLRPDLGCYNNREVKSPNLDKLAGEGTLFLRQYVTQPTCGASRFSLLTGKRPRHPVEIKNEAIEKQISGRPRGASPETFIEQFRNRGYYTVGIGKISHSPDGYVYGYNELKSDRLELPNSWDEMLFDPGKWKTGWNAFFGYANGENRQLKKGQVRPYEAGDVSDEGYADGLTANLAVEKLRALAAGEKPFFLGVGFFKPHLPFTAPKKYWDLYREEELSLTPSPMLPVAVDRESLHESREFNQYKEGAESASLDKPVSDPYARKLRHAYYAGISYVDAQVGKVLGELKKLGLDKNTIVVIWGDHGWHLGDYRVWGKHTLFDRSLQSVFILKKPGQKPVISDAVVSSVDIYPTLVELCLGEKTGGLDGRSLVPLVNGAKIRKRHQAAYSYYNNGISLRTDRYRLTRYFRRSEPVTELYDHFKDPFENRNIAKENPEIVRKLIPLWEKGNTGIFEHAAR